MIERASMPQICGIDKPVSSKHFTEWIVLERDTSGSDCSILIGGAGMAWFVTHIPSSPFDREPAQAMSADLALRGEQVARQADCVACHSLPNAKPFAGGLEMGTPLGSIFATNITLDKQTGIGSLLRDNQDENRIASSKDAPDRIAYCLTRMLPMPC